MGINDEFEELDHHASEQNLLEVIRNETIGLDRGKNGCGLFRSSYQALAKKRRNNDTIAKNDIHHFIENIYNNCKKYNIKPFEFIGFIKDLFDFYPSLEYKFPSGINKNSDLSLSTDSENKSINTINSTRAPNGEYDNDILQNLEIKGNTSTKQTNGSADVSIEIPFISQVSYYINQIKLECKEREQYRNSLEIEISVLENKKSTQNNDLREINSKNKTILSHLRWYHFLKQDLSENHNMNLDEEIPFFSSIINDFKTYNYNIVDILKVYKQNQSLRKDREHIQNDIDLNAPILQSLLKQIASLNSQLDVSRITMKTYWELDVMGFNSKSLKQLHSMIIEIALANDIPVWDAVTKFLTDVENQDDFKLGFETKIKELTTAREKLESEAPQYRSNLQTQSLVVPSLLYLMNNGVTNDDIINMSQLLVSFQNISFLTNISSQGRNSASSIGYNNIVTTSKNEAWNVLINKVRSLQNIDSKSQLQSHVTSYKID